MSSSQDIAYLVPKPLWERLQEKLKSGETAPTPQQAGGGVVGLDGHGNVDANQLLQAMAVNMDIASNPQAPFVKYADEMLKKVMSDPNISQEDKVTYMASYVKSYNTQKHKAQTPAAKPEIKPEPKKEPEPQLKFKPGVVTPPAKQSSNNERTEKLLTRTKRTLRLRKLKKAERIIQSSDRPGKDLALKKIQTEYNKVKNQDSEGANFFPKLPDFKPLDNRLDFTPIKAMKVPGWFSKRGIDYKESKNEMV